MLSALSLEKKKDVNQLSIPHHLIANTYFYPCLGQQFFKKNTHLLLQVLDFVCQSISYNIYQQRGLPKCSHAGRVSPRDSHTCPSPWPAWQLLECLIGNFRSLSSQYKSHPVKQSSQRGAWSSSWFHTNLSRQHTWSETTGFQRWMNH